MLVTLFFLEFVGFPDVRCVFDAQLELGSGRVFPINMWRFVKAKLRPYHRI